MEGNTGTYLFATIMKKLFMDKKIWIRKYKY